MPRPPKPDFEEYFRQVKDTGMKCPNCGGRIFHGRGKMDLKNPYKTRQLYACQCMAYVGKEISKISPLTLDRWNHLLSRLADWEKNPLCCALPTPDLEPDVKAKMQRTGTYDPSVGKGQSKTERWSEASRIAREAIEELIEIQSDYEYWRDNLPEGLAEGPTAELLSEVCDLDLNTAIEIIEEADEIALPKGFGRD
jgi:DNA-directed RNA polymerase subunit RPC12/RpoP